MSNLLSPLVGAALLLIVPAVALAQGTPDAAPPAAPSAPTDKGDAAEAKSGGRQLAACRADAQKLCSEAAKGGRFACLKQNSAKLSPECTTAIADLEAKAKALREACAEDVKANCAAGAKGRSIVQCLRESRAKLSPACGTAFEARYPKGSN
jgi:hypothetical protein